MPVQLRTDDVEQISKQLEDAAAGTTSLDPQVAYQAASFYYDNNKDMKQAAKWIDQALENNPNAYFMWARKAQILARLGKSRRRFPPRKNRRRSSRSPLFQMKRRFGVIRS